MYALTSRQVRDLGSMFRDKGNKNHNIPLDELVGDIMYILGAGDSFVLARELKDAAEYEVKMVERMLEQDS